MPGYSFFKSEGENYGNVKSIYTRDIRYMLISLFLQQFYLRNPTRFYPVNSTLCNFCFFLSPQKIVNPGAGAVR